MSAPMRQYRLTLKLDANSLSELADALFNLSHRVETGEMTAGMSGGVGSGYLYELLHDPEQTHDKYYADIREYLGKKADDEKCPLII